MKSFTAKLRDIDQVKFPIVKAAFKGKGGNVYMGYMLIDTGSMHCILNHSALQVLDDSAIQSNNKMNICSVQSQGALCTGVQLNFKMGNGEFTDVFYVSDAMDSDGMFGPGALIGIIGIQFLIKHNLVLDYREESLHTSDGKLEQAPKDYNFFFPMSFGMQQYNLPVVGLVNGDKEFVMVADSGANATLITEYVLKESGYEYEDINEKGSFTCYAHETMNTTIKNVTLNLLSIGGTEDNPKLCSAKEECQITDAFCFIMNEQKDEEGQYRQPISGLLSSPFMHRHKWVLDFSLGVIYA